MDALLHGLVALLRWLVLGLIQGLLEWLFLQLCYALGWLALRLLTLGRHPRQPLHQADPDAPRNVWIIALGFICLAGLVAGLIIRNG
ncbi:hypothetical protein [Pseudomonas sp. F(2018)]|uniref:hypothetical protein n=1 Tax=Pseudomonas sp. F(2018) TaxID=2502240 RepID=UPI00211552B8|nr:hypothetical protein [Pseudomonas sp. F(2018)]